MNEALLSGQLGRGFRKGRLRDGAGRGPLPNLLPWGHGPTGEESSPTYGISGPSGIYGHKPLFLTILAACALFVAFVLNWDMNRGAYLVVEKSELLSRLGTLEGASLSLLVAASLVLFGLNKYRLPFNVTIWHLLGGLVLFFIIALTLTQDPNLTATIAVQLFLFSFYSAPLCFGLYGLFLHKPVYLVISAMFSFFITAGTPNTASELPQILLFSFCFLLFIETGESSVRCWGYIEEGRLSPAYASSFVDSYLRNLALFLSLSLLLTLLTLNLPSLLGALGLQAVAASLELNSIYGRVAGAVAVLGGLGLLRFLHDRGYTKSLLLWTGRAAGHLRALAARQNG
ncbi:MAG: hypothetical protein QXH42_00315 [Thermoplasmata archaeon]